MTDFDSFGSRYEEILNDELKIFGMNAGYFAKYKAECVLGYLGPDFKGRILDYGCGVGLVTKHLEKCFGGPGIKILGYDISDESINQAHTNPGGAVFTSDFNEISKEPFDAIIMSNVLHHSDRQGRVMFLKKAVSLLKKRGRLFIFEHNPYNPFTRLIVRLSALDRNASLISLADTIKLLRLSGLDIVEKGYIVFFPQLLSATHPFEKAMKRIPLGAQYMCVGRSPI